MKIETGKIYTVIKKTVSANLPSAQLTKQGANLDGVCEKFLCSEGIAGKAQILIQNSTNPHRLPLSFLPDSLSLKDVCRKSNSFGTFIKRNLKPNQKIIKDTYSAEDLLGKLYTSDEFIHSDKGFTDAIHDCIAVLLNNKDDAYLLHLSPGKHKTPKDIEYMQKRILSFIDNLTSRNKKCSAFLFGGQKGVSEDLHTNILAALNKRGIKPDEILFDKPGSGPHSFYYDLKDGIVLDKYMFFDLEDIKRTFGLVNVSSGN